MTKRFLLLLAVFAVIVPAAHAADAPADSKERVTEAAAQASVSPESAEAQASVSQDPAAAQTAAPAQASSGFAEIKRPDSVPMNSPTDSYLIHSGDKLKISVQGENDLSGVYTVNMMGEVRFPLIEKIRAEGLSLSQFRDDLESALGRDFLNNPQVEVLFEESISNSVMVLGRVNRPGSYSLPPRVTFLQMISIAGGFEASAAFSNCRVMRLGAPANISIPINVDAILGGQEKDIELKPGDTIFVPKIASTTEEKDDYLNSVAIMGQVSKPGNYRLAEGMTLIRLLSQAGGLVRGADSGKLIVTRKLKGGGQDTQYIDAKKILDGIERDFSLQAGDVIFVPGARTDVNDIVNLSDAVTVLGHVNKPGNYDLVPGLNLVQLISEAGGFTPLADSSHVRVTRGEIGEEKQVFSVNVAAIIAGKADNMKLRKGDIVYVPESAF